MAEPLGLGPIEARLAALDADPGTDTLQQLAGLAEDVPALLAEVRRLRAERASALAQAWAEAARRVRETASLADRAGSQPGPSVRVARLHALAGRLDRMAAGPAPAAEVVAGGGL